VDNLFNLDKWLIKVLRDNRGRDRLLKSLVRKELEWAERGFILLRIYSEYNYNKRSLKINNVNFLLPLKLGILTLVIQVIQVIRMLLL
jgi:hypothetical protein